MLYGNGHKILVLPIPDSPLMSNFSPQGIDRLKFTNRNRESKRKCFCCISIMRPNIEKIITIFQMCSTSINFFVVLEAEERRMLEGSGWALEILR